MKKILIAEDDKEINRLLCDYLTASGYTAIGAYNGFEAMSKISQNTDISLILLDLMMPLQSGDMFLKKLREISDIPVIVLSAKDSVASKVELIRMGADDYITKPFDLDELSVRIEAVLRRCKSSHTNDEAQTLTFGKITLDVNAAKVFVDSNEITLTSKEYSILKLLMQNPNKLFSKANLYESVWNEPFINEDKIIKVHISNLRNKLKEYDSFEYIETVWNMGYKLNFKKE